MTAMATDSGQDSIALELEKLCSNFMRSPVGFRSSRKVLNILNDVNSKLPVWIYDVRPGGGVNMKKTRRQRVAAITTVTARRGT